MGIHLSQITNNCEQQTGEEFVRPHALTQDARQVSCGAVQPQSSSGFLILSSKYTSVPIP